MDGELDKLDRKLLYELDSNARQSLNSVAKKLKIGRNVALYRFNRLKERGIIKGTVTEINNYLLGYHTFRIFFKIGNYEQKELEEMLKFIEDSEKTFWFSRVLGLWDLDMIFLVREIGEFEEFKRELLFKFNKIIENSEVSLLTGIYGYPLDYLISDKRTNIKPKIYDINTKGSYNLDSKDKELLFLLSKDATIGIIGLASKLKLSINTVKRRMKNLEKNKVITGYRLFIDTEKLGYQHYKLHLYLKKYNESDYKKLKSWLETKPFMTYIDQYINGADFEFELHLKTEEEYLKFFKELYSEFSTIIQDHFVIKFYDVRIFKYLPGN